MLIWSEDLRRCRMCSGLGRDPIRKAARHQSQTRSRTYSRGQGRSYITRENSMTTAFDFKAMDITGMQQDLAQYGAVKRFSRQDAPASLAKDIEGVGVAT